MRVSRAVVILVCLPVAVALIATHASARDKRPKRTEPAESVQERVWPAPPSPARIRYEGSLSGAADFKKKQGRFKRFLLGADDEARIALRKPYGVTTDAAGRVYVSDTGLGAVLVFDETAREVRLLGNRGATHLATPVGLAIDELERLWVADAGLGQVLCFDEEGRVALAVGGNEGLRNPAGLAIDRQRRRVYIADSHRHQIFVYGTDGRFEGIRGTRGTADGHFNFPTNLALDGEGNLLVVDTGNFRVQRFDPEGRFLSKFGQAGDGYGDFHRPKGIALDTEGHLYVTDAAFNNFQIFDRQGQLLLFVGSLGREPGSFWLPAGMHIDSRNRIYVVDQINRRVQIFRYVSQEAPEGSDPDRAQRRSFE